MHSDYEEFELLECPFCASGKEYLESLYRIRENLMAVKCMICQATGPYSGNLESSIGKWNMRKTPKDITKPQNINNNFTDWDIG